eukprot:jgi/Tetstr1/434678/TSEL_002506.t2
MAALIVALDELLPFVLAANQDFTPYLARAWNHAEAIDKAFRFRLAFLRRLNELQVADVHEDVAVDAGVVAKDAFRSDELGQRTLDLLSSSLTAQTLKSYAGRLSQFAEFCHDSESINPLEATTATVVRYVAWIVDVATAPSRDRLRPPPGHCTAEPGTFRQTCSSLSTAEGQSVWNLKAATVKRHFRVCSSDAR